MTPELITTPWGTFLDYPGTSIGRTLKEGRFWDAHLRPYMEEAGARNADATALDIGAYIGFHTVELCRHFKRVVAFEPVLQTVGLLQDNLRANNVNNALVVPLGAYDRMRRLGRAYQSQVGWNPHGPENAPSVPWFPLNGGTCANQISVVPADSFVMPNEQVGFVKIDAQGCDLRVLYGLEATVQRCRPLMVMEWEASFAVEHGDTWEHVENWAERRRYSVSRITQDFWDYVLRPL